MEYGIPDILNELLEHDRRKRLEIFEDDDQRWPFGRGLGTFLTVRLSRRDRQVSRFRPRVLVVVPNFHSVERPDQLPALLGINVDVVVFVVGVVAKVFVVVLRLQRFSLREEKEMLK